MGIVARPGNHAPATQPHCPRRIVELVVGVRHNQDRASRTESLSSSTYSTLVDDRERAGQHFAERGVLKGSDTFRQRLIRQVALMTDEQQCPLAQCLRGLNGVVIKILCNPKGRGSKREDDWRRTIVQEPRYLERRFNFAEEVSTIIEGKSSHASPGGPVSLRLCQY